MASRGFSSSPILDFSAIPRLRTIKDESVLPDAATRPPEPVSQRKKKIQAVSLLTYLDYERGSFDCKLFTNSLTNQIINVCNATSYISCLDAHPNLSRALVVHKSLPLENMGRSGCRERTGSLRAFSIARLEDLGLSSRNMGRA